jgi:hypothetical protein
MLQCMPAESRQSNGQPKRQARVKRLLMAIHKSCFKLQDAVMGPAQQLSTMHHDRELCRARAV